jgi:hypothetical protein
MNHRRALRVSPDIGLGVFLIVIVGVVLWSTDELLGWNILPDWIDKYAQLLVIILSILAAFAVVISIMCSFAVMAEAAAAQSGVAAPTRSRGARVLVALGILLAFGIMYGLHKVDQYRARQRAEAEQQRVDARYAEVRAELSSRMPNILALFSPDLVDHLTQAPTPGGDEALARLLDAIEASTPFAPTVSVLVNAAAPYTHCIINTLPEHERQFQPGERRYLRRQFLTGFPSGWEHEAVKAGLEGRAMEVPRDMSGVFIDTHAPSNWGTLTRDGQAVGVLMLRGSM